MTNTYDFTNQTVLVTGGAAGIGFETTKTFLQGGAEVHVWDYSQEALDNAAQELSEYKNKVHFHQVDVSNYNSCETAASNLPTKLNCLVNNAGITRDKSFKKMDEATFRQVIDTNLTGVFNVTKTMLERFVDQGPKRIVNISSVVALYGNFGQTNYVAAKAGVIGMTKTWARELARKGFTVNAVAPGFTETAMVRAMPKEVLEGMAEKVPVGRLGTTRDIANAVTFLASDNASYINGTTLSVDGGLIC